MSALPKQSISPNAVDFVEKTVNGGRELTPPLNLFVLAQDRFIISSAYSVFDPKQ